MPGSGNVVDEMQPNDERQYRDHLSLITLTIASALPITSIP